jgi:hypothetical protein
MDAWLITSIILAAVVLYQAVIFSLFANKMKNIIAKRNKETNEKNAGDREPPS